MGAAEKDWKMNALALDKVGVMSRRGIAKALGISKSTVSDYLRATKSNVEASTEWIKLPDKDFALTDDAGVTYTFWRNAGGSDRYRMYWRGPVGGATVCAGVSESQIRAGIASGFWQTV